MSKPFLRTAPSTSFNPGGRPTVHETAFVDERALVTGLVTIEENVIVKAGSLLVADEGFPFKIGAGTNIQEGCIFHGLETKDHHGNWVKEHQVFDEQNNGYSILIEPDVTIAHGVTIHGPCKIGAKTFVGFNATVHHSEVGKNCFIAIGARVNGVKIPNNRYVSTGDVIETQKQADGLPEITAEKEAFVAEVRQVNQELRKGYLDLMLQNAK